MGRQTNQKEMIFPDGFQMGIDSGDGFLDVGIIAGGATATLNWDTFYLDAGNYEGLVDKSRNPRVALAPSALWNWSPRVIASVFPGFFETSGASGGQDIDFAGDSRQVTLDRVAVRLTHFSDSDDHALIEADITAVDDGTNNQYVTIPKTTFSGALDWTALIDGLVSVGKEEWKYADLDNADAQGGFATDDTNLYLIYNLGTYLDLAAAKTALAGTVVTFRKDIDWQFTVWHARVESGGSFTFKGVNEDGLNEVSVSFEGKPDPDEEYRLFKFFKAT